MTATIDRAAAYRAKASDYAARRAALERQRAAHLTNGRRDLAERLNVSIDSMSAAEQTHRAKADALKEGER